MKKSLMLLLALCVFESCLAMHSEQLQSDEKTGSTPDFKQHANQLRVALARERWGCFYYLCCCFCPKPV